MDYQVWLESVNQITQTRWQYRVDSSLSYRLYGSNVSPEEAAEILYQQFIKEANLYVEDLFRRHRMGLWR